jgi:glycosyltransferase involved in cell wall biosynthesis
MAKKVLQILGELKYSGAEIMLTTAQRYFLMEGLETHVLSTGNKEGVFGEKLKQLGITIHHIPFQRKLCYFIRLRNFVKTHRFDIIHIHTERAFLWTVLSCRLIWQSRKIVRTIHSTFRFQGYLKYRRILHHWCAKNILHVQFITISNAVYNNEKHLYCTSSVIINNWIDTERFKIKEGTRVKTDNKSSCTLISVGCCSELKNHKAILKLLKSLKDRGKIFKYLHVGTGELEEEEKRLAKELGINKFVSFLGTCDNVEEQLGRADYFLIPSAYEGLNIACIEAMSSRRILLANDVPGLHSLITNGLNGFIVDFTDIEYVSDFLLTIHNNPILKMKVAQNAREYVVKNFGLNNIEKLIRLYS